MFGKRKTPQEVAIIALVAWCSLMAEARHGKTWQDRLKASLKARVARRRTIRAGEALIGSGASR